MRRAAPIVLLTVFLAHSADAQVQMHPTAPPLVTAENEPWYLDGEPIVYAGQHYYAAGALVFFNGNEMVRSGFYRGVPLFTRTTLEPYSVVYVPVGRGLMQPFERPRSGDLAGTVGSRTPSFPVALATAETGASPQAAAPPVLMAPGASAVLPPETAASLGSADGVAGTRSIGTAGGAVPRQPERSHVRLGGEPSGLNAIFIEYQGARWFSLGTSIEVDPAKLRRLDDYRGFPVWEGEDRDQLLVGTSRTGTLAVRYSRQKPDLQIR